MNYTKNLLTERNFRLSQFSDVANLSHQRLPEGKESANADKARRRILQLSLATAGIIAGLAAFARFGAKLPGGLGLSRLVVKHLDFARKGRSMSISPNMLFAYMLVFVAGAMDSARDNLERKEVASRLAIILPYMLFVQEKVNLLTAKLAFPRLLKPNPGGSQGILRLSDKLFDEGLLRKLFQTKRLGKQAVMSLTDIARLAPKAQMPLLRNKIGHYLLSYGVGVIGVLVGTAFLNRYWTQKRFEAAQKQARQPVAPESAFEQQTLPYRAFRMTQS